MAKIDVKKIDGYDEMTAEEKIQALESFDFEDVERYKKAVTKANSEVADWKRKHNALLSQEEQQKQARDEELAVLKAKIEQMEKDKLMLAYKSQLVSLGYEQQLADSTAKAILNSDTETLFSNQKAFLEAHDKQLQAQILKATPIPPAGNGSATMNIDDFKKMSVQERYEFAMQNPDEYKKIYT